MSAEISRVLRHGLPVVVTYLIAKGYVPPALQGSLLELGGAVITFGAAYFASRRVARR